MTLPALDVKATAGVDVLASEVSQDIRAGAWPHDPQHRDTSALFQWRPGAPSGYTELCESIAEFKRDLVRRTKLGKGSRGRIASGRSADGP